MHEIVVKISFIIWMIYYWILVNREIARKNKNKEKYTWSLLKKDLFYLFRLDNLFFLIMFHLYKGFDNESVTIYLYFVFVVASLVYIFYDINEKYKILKNKIMQEKIYYFISLIVFIIPIIYYFKTNDIPTTCFYTLLINFLVPIIIFMTRIIWHTIKRRKQRS